MEEKLQKKNTEKYFLKLLFITITILLIYSNGFSSSWHLDDYSSILDNYKIKNITTCLKDMSANSRGICDLSFAVNYYFCGEDVFWYHVVNILIHIIVSLFVYHIIKLTINLQYKEISDGLIRNCNCDESGLPKESLLLTRLPRFLGPLATTKDKQNILLNNLPFIGSLLYAIHPLQTQAVTYIVQRYTSLAAMFYMLSLLLFIKARENSTRFLSSSHLFFYICSFISALLAMRTKEIAVTIPFILLLYDYLFIKKEPETYRNSLIYLFPFFALILIPIFSRIYAVNPDMTGVGESIGRSFKDTVKIGRMDYFFTSINVLLTYIRMIFLPVNQSIYHTYRISNSLFENHTYISLFIHLIIIAFAFLIYKQSKLISFGILWFYITISVESSFIPIRDVIFEHRLYLPLAGMGFLIAGLVMLNAKWKKIFDPFFIVVIFLFSMLAYERNFVWKDEYSLWADAVKKSPESSISRYNLGNALYDKGNLKEAIKEFKKASILDPGDLEAYINLGNIYYDLGQLNKAVEEYKTALKVKPDTPEIHFNLGRVYFKLGLFKKAIEEYKTTLRYKPVFTEGYINLGDAYFKNEEYDRAIEEYMAALKLQPRDERIYFNLGNVYYSLKQFDEALKSYKSAVELNPNIAQIYFTLGNVYFRKGMTDLAISEYQTALRLKPDYAEAQYNLEIAYRSKRLKEGTKK